MTLPQLKQLPEYSYYEHGLQPDYFYRVRHRQRPHYTAEDRPHPPYRYTPPHTRYYDPRHAGPNSDFYEWTYSPRRFLATAVMDRRLINEDGKRIGWVRDLSLNLETHEIDRIIIASEDILGETVHLVLDYQPLGFASYGLVYDIEPEELKTFVQPYAKQ